MPFSHIQNGLIEGGVLLPLPFNFALRDSIGWSKKPRDAGMIKAPNFNICADDYY